MRVAGRETRGKGGTANFRGWIRFTEHRDALLTRRVPCRQWNELSRRERIAWGKK